MELQRDLLGHMSIVLADFSLMCGFIMVKIIEREVLKYVCIGVRENFS